MQDQLCFENKVYELQVYTSASHKRLLLAVSVTE